MCITGVCYNKGNHGAFTGRDLLCITLSAGICWQQVSASTGLQSRWQSLVQHPECHHVAPKLQVRPPQTWALCQGTRWGEARLAGHGRDRATWTTHKEGVGKDYIVYSDRRGEETSCCVRKEEETAEWRTESIYMRMLRLAQKTLLVW